MPFKQVREKKPLANSKTTNGDGSAGAGQTTLDARTLLVNGSNGTSHGGIVDEMDDGAGGDPNAQLELETKSATAADSSQFQNGWPGSRDVEMR